MNLSRALLPMPLAVTVALLFLFVVNLAQAQTLAGSVVGASGQTSAQRGGQQVALAIGAPIYVGDTVQTGADGKLKLRMNDGSVLSLAPSSNLRVDNYLVDGSGRRQGATLSVGQGLLRSVTAPVDRPASFEVDTAIGTAAVRSTDWFVDTASGQEQVSVMSGSVVLASRATGRSVVIPQGSGSRLFAGRDPEPPRQLSPAEFSGLIGRTEGAAGGAPPPARPPAGGYYPPARPPAGGYYPPAPSPYYPPGTYYPPGGISPGGGVIVIPGGGQRGGGGGQPGGPVGREPPSR